MKSNIHKITLLACIMLIACQKDMFDIRSKYVGAYDITLQAYRWSPLERWDTTFHYVGNVSLGSGKDRLLIDLPGGQNLDCVLNEDGSVYSSQGSGEFRTSGSFVFLCKMRASQLYKETQLLGVKQSEQ